jgi:antitoxin ParD1/3/4
MSEPLMIDGESADRLRQQVAEGHYCSIDDALNHALCLLEAFEAENAQKLVWLRAAIRAGDESGLAEEIDWEEFRRENHRRFSATRAAE